MAPSRWTVGTVLENRFTLTRPLDEGAFGEVWSASDAMSAGRTVMLRFVRKDLLASPESLARFDQATRALGAMAHPHLLAPLGRGAHADARYAVYDAFESRSLAAWLDAHRAQGRPPAPHTVAPIMDALCAAVEVAHQLRVPTPVLHGGISPACALLREVPGATPLLELADFAVGPTTLASPPAPASAPYLAPEQALGAPGALVPACDVFSLAVVFIELFTLRRGPSEKDAWWNVAAQRESDVRAMLAAMNPPLPAPLWDTLVRALRRDPSQRFADAGEFRAQLGRALPAQSALAFAPTGAHEAVSPALLPHTTASPLLPATSVAPAVRPASVPPPAMPATSIPPTAWVPATQAGFVAPQPAPRSSARTPVLVTACIVILGLGAMIGWGFIARAELHHHPHTLPPPPTTATPTDPPIACAADMASVPGGTFQMGDTAGLDVPTARPVHPVTVHSFCIDRNEVTVSQYASCIANGRCTPSARIAPEPRLHGFYTQFCNGARLDHPTEPINCVDWTQARAYCAAQGKRLPSEAEWEFAARGNDGRIYPWGNDPPGPAYANLCGEECRNTIGAQLSADAPRLPSDHIIGTAPVGSFAAGATPTGILDLAGNVSEWVEDGDAEYTVAAQTDPIVNPAAPTHVVRGGSFFSVDRGALATHRVAFATTHDEPMVGFRCAFRP